MKISAINSAYTQNKSQTLNNKQNTFTPRFKGEDEFNIKPKTLIKHFSFAALAIAASIALVKNSGKIKDTISGFLGKSKKNQTLYIPFDPGELVLDTKKLKALPKNIKTKAIAELNGAMTAEDKLEVIKKFGIGKY